MRDVNQKYNDVCSLGSCPMTREQEKHMPYATSVTQNVEHVWRLPVNMTLSVDLL